MTPAGIETETFRFVAQHLNHCATAHMVLKLGENLVKVPSGRISQYTSKTQKSSETRSEKRHVLIILIVTLEEKENLKELRHQLTSKFIKFEHEATAHVSP